MQQGNEINTFYVNAQPALDLLVSPSALRAAWMSGASAHGADASASAAKRYVLAISMALQPSCKLKCWTLMPYIHKLQACVRYWKQ